MQRAKHQEVKLIDYLKHHEPLSSLQELNLASVEITDEVEIAAMDIAIRSGRVDVVLWLIENDFALPEWQEPPEASSLVSTEHPVVKIDIHPLHALSSPLLSESKEKSNEKKDKETFQLHAHFPLMANVLAALGAYDSNYVDPTVTAALFARAIRKNEDKLIGLLLNNLQDASAFIELMLQSKKLEIVQPQQLFAKCKHPLRQDPEILTAAFWAAIQDASLLDKMNLSNEHKLVTLQQLEGKSEAFDAMSKFVGSSIMKRYKDLQQFYSVDVQSIYERKSYTTQELSLTPFQQKAKRFAAAAEINLLKQCDITIEDYLQLIRDSFRKQNYVALNTIIEVCKTPIELAVSLIKHKEDECALFFIIAADMDVYELLFACRNSPFMLTNLLTSVWTKEGLLTHLIGRSVQKELAATEQVSELTANLVNYGLVEDQLRKQIFEQQIVSTYADDFIKEEEALVPKSFSIFDSFTDCLIRMQQERMQKRQQQQQEIQQKKKELHHKQQTFVRTLAKRIDLNLPQFETKESLALPYEPFNQPLMACVLSYLETEDHKVAKDISPLFWNSIAQVNPNAPWLIAGKIKQLCSQIESIEKFLEIYNKESTKWLSSNTYDDDKIENFAILFIGALGIIFTGIFACNKINPRDDDLLAPCLMGGIISASGFLIAFIFLLKEKFCPRARTVADLNNSYLETGGSRICYLKSNTVRRAAINMCNLFSHVKANPFVRVQLTSTKVGALLTLTNDTLALKKTQLQSLLEKQRKEFKVEAQTHRNVHVP